MLQNTLLSLTSHRRSLKAFSSISHRPLAWVGESQVQLVLTDLAKEKAWQEKCMPVGMPRS